MRAWLRNDRVYQTIMNGALWILVIAALSTTKWPELIWSLGALTAVLVVIVAVVYWVAVVTSDNDNPNSTADHQSSELSKTADTPKGRAVEQQPPPAKQREELVGAYLTSLRRKIETLREGHLEELSKKSEVALRYLKNWENISEVRQTTEDIVLRNWLAHARHHGDDLPWVKSHRRSFTARTLATVVTGEEETSGKVVVTVGSVRIEIQEDDPNKTTNVQIISPKEAVATNLNLTDKAEHNQQKPEQVSQQRPATTTVH